MKCENCGTEFKEGFFCPECGTPVKTQILNYEKEETQKQNINENNNKSDKQKSWYDKFCSIYYKFSDKNDNLWKKIFKTSWRALGGLFGFWLLCEMFNWNNPMTRFVDNIIYSVFSQLDEEKKEGVTEEIINEITSDDTTDYIDEKDEDYYNYYEDTNLEDTEDILEDDSVQYNEDFDYEEGGINNPLEISQLKDLYPLNDWTITVGITDEMDINDLYLYKDQDEERRPKYKFYSMIPVKLLYDMDYNNEAEVTEVSDRYLEIYRVVADKGNSIEFHDIDNPYIDDESKIDSFEILRSTLLGHYVKFDYIINKNNIDYDCGYINTTSYNDDTGRTENVVIDTSYCPDVLELEDGIIKMYCVELYTIGERDHAFALLKYKKEKTNNNVNDATDNKNNTQIFEDSNEYICANSDTVKLTTKEVKKLAKTNKIRLAKNEIYARHGRKFTDEELQKYFNAKSWYYGIIEPEDFDESVFNKIEKYNIRLLVKYE